MSLLLGQALHRRVWVHSCTRRRAVEHASAAQADIWAHALRQLRVRPKEASLVLTEPPMPLPPIQELTDQARRDSGCAHSTSREDCPPDTSH